SCQSRGQCLERRNLSFLCLVLMEHLADGVLHGIAELPELETFQPQRQENTGAHKQYQGWDTPNDSIEPAVAGSYGVIKPFHTLSPFNSQHITIRRRERRGLAALPSPDSCKNENAFPNLFFIGRLVR